MGYRSEAAVVITAQEKKHFDKYLNELKELELVKDADEFTNNEKDCIALKWNYVKWYDDWYEDIKEFKK